MHIYAWRYGPANLASKIIYNKQEVLPSKARHPCNVTICNDKRTVLCYLLDPSQNVCTSPAVLDPDHRRPIQGWAAPASSS